MCDTCGCGNPNATAGHSHTHTHVDADGNVYEHSHDHHGHTHDHDHEHEHEHEHGQEHHHHHARDAHGHTHRHEPEAPAKVVTLERKILSRNDELAARNREWLEKRGIVAINLISSPGTGKTYLLEKTLEGLAGRVACAVITGDQRTDHDARRLAGKGAVIRQIETVSSCHLEAERVGELLPEVTAQGARLLFIENVGNLVCPASFDLGENFKVGLLSTTEGEDKPVKYPVLFSQVPVVVLTKLDLAPYLEWNREVCRDYLRAVCPEAQVFELSAKTGEGMAAWLEYLERLVG